MSTITGTARAQQAHVSGQQHGTPPVQFIAPAPRVSGRAINFSTVVSMAGGHPAPYPYPSYRFGGGQIERLFWENV